MATEVVEMSYDRGRICPVTPDEDCPVKWFLAGVFVIFCAAPAALLLLGATLGFLFQLIFGNTFEAM